jgi:hypothetical protein
VLVRPTEPTASTRDQAIGSRRDGGDELLGIVSTHDAVVGGNDRHVESKIDERVGVRLAHVGVCLVETRPAEMNAVGVFHPELLTANQPVAGVIVAVLPGDLVDDHGQVVV